jgi:pectin methylesterase-like acyl-CoA thioesterase
MKRILIALTLSIALAGCANNPFTKLQQIYTVATTATVPAELVRPAANSFDILKGTAANFASFCIKNNFAPAVCDVDTRRKISTFVKQGTTARVALRASLATGQPALSTVYNLLVGAVNGLQGTPAATFTGG